LGGIAPNVFQLLTLRPPIRTNLSDSEGSSAGVITDVKLPEITDLAFPLFGAKAMGVLGRMELRDYHLPGAAHGQGAP